MAFRIRWSEPAIQSFEAICQYIEQFSAPFAKLLAREINLRVREIGHHPLMGRRVPEFPDKDYREVIFQDYRIIYRIREETVEIGLIWHGARVLQEPFR
mgnify:CR=1 FL=1